MTVIQKEIQLPAFPRGFHLVTDLILRQIPEISRISAGVFHAHILHTSASLSLNENADSSVRRDCLSFFNYFVREDFPYEHSYEGADDMPAHIKAMLLGNCVSVPISDGKLRTGTWQGIYLGEHRDSGGPRSIVLTLTGSNSAKID